MRRASTGFIAALFIAIAVPATAMADDTIFGLSPNTLPQIIASLTSWFGSAERPIADAISVLFNVFKTDPHQEDHPNPDENPVGAFTARIGSSKFKVFALGAANLKMIGGPFLYQEIQGGVGIEYDFVETGPGPGATLIALRVSPLYGEIALAKTLAEYAPIPGLPNESFLGSAVGVEIAKRYGEVELGARAYANELFELGQANANGLSFYAAAYARIRLAGADRDEKTGALRTSYYLRPTLNFYDRGPEKSDFYALGLQERLWEALVYFEVK